MISKNYLTIKDYLLKSGVRKNQFQDITNIRKTKRSLQGDFYHILSGFENKPSHTPIKSIKPLTAEDYLRNPIKSKRSEAPTVLSDPMEVTIKNVSTEKKQEHKPSKDVAIKKELQENKQHAINDYRIDQKIRRSIRNASVKYKVPGRLISAVIKAESNFAVGAMSSAGAQGLMQLMPATAEELGVTDPFDIEQNIDGGTRYLKKMMRRYNGDIKLSLAAYNAGPGTVDKYDRNIPPYPETKKYVEKVIKYFQRSEPNGADLAAANHQGNSLPG